VFCSTLFIWIAIFYSGPARCSLNQKFCIKGKYGDCKGTAGGMPSPLATSLLNLARFASDARPHPFDRLRPTPTCPYVRTAVGTSTKKWLDRPCVIHYIP